MAKAKEVRRVVFEISAKDGAELLDKKNTTNAALFYRALVAAEKPLRRQEIYQACKAKCESTAAWERLGHQIGDTLGKLRKLGFVKRTEQREEPKPKAKRSARPRKPRTAAPAPVAAEAQAAS